MAWSNKGGKAVGSYPGLPAQDFKERSSMPRMASSPAARNLESRGPGMQIDKAMGNKQTLSGRRPSGGKGTGDQSF